MRDDNKLYSVHFLRFLAAFAVVVNHMVIRYKPTLIIGAAGVDLFFVISGVVIGIAILSKETAGSFALRRLIRIYPIYWIATLAYLAFSMWAWGTHPSLAEILGSIVIFPVYGANWHPIYWPAWTLEYEISFYALAAFLIATVRESAAAICVIVLVSLSILYIPIPGDGPLQYFDFVKFIEFAVGLLIAYALKQHAFSDKRIGSALVLLAFLLLLANINIKSTFHVMTWGIPVTMLLVGMLNFEGSGFLRNRIFKIGGDASYAIYLFHITTIELIATTAWKFGVNVDTLKPFAATLFSIFCVAASLLVGVLVHLYIEKPILRYLRVALLDVRERKAFATE